MPDGIDVEEYYDRSLLTEVSLSPSGDRVAFAGGNPENWYELTEVFVRVDESDVE